LLIVKKSDLVLLAGVVVVLAPFFLFPGVFRAYQLINGHFPYLASFVKFAILATLGESLGLRIRTGHYNHRGFGLIPRALVWGVLGISIKMAFVIFGEGAPMVMRTLGFSFPTDNPADILRTTSFSWLKLGAAFSVGLTLNLFFAPVFMLFHRITDMHIQQTGGSLHKFFTPIRVQYQLTHLDWSSMWNFVLKKTIPFFWIPAQTLNFLLPEEWPILVAALYSIVLGVFLSLASLMEIKRL